jgi:hypothetical protein
MLVDQRRAGATRANTGEIVLERVDALAHAGLGISLDVVEHETFPGESGKRMIIAAGLLASCMR